MPTASSADSVPRIAPPSAEEFRERYVKTHQPVIIVGAMEDWPARQWSGEYLAARFGDRRVPVAHVTDNRVTDDPAVGFSHREEPLDDFIERIGAPGPVDGYAMFLLGQTLTELESDLRTPAFAPPAPWSVWRFWMSAPETRSPLHMDLPDNLFAQVVGRKRVTLFSPAEEWKLYRNAPWSRLPHMSRVDAEAPDLARYPRFAAARPLRCMVEPGELLYIPRFWWHQITSIDCSISVNYWWATGWVWRIVQLALAYQRLRKLTY